MRNSWEKPAKARMKAPAANAVSSVACQVVARLLLTWRVTGARSWASVWMLRAMPTAATRVSTPSRMSHRCVSRKLPPGRDQCAGSSRLGSYTTIADPTRATSAPSVAAWVIRRARVVVVHPEASHPHHQHEQSEQRTRGHVHALPQHGGVDQRVVEAVQIDVGERMRHAGVDELGGDLVVEWLQHEVELADQHDAAQDRQQHQPGERQVAREHGGRPPGVAAEQALARREVVREEAQVVDRVPAGEAGAVRQILSGREIRRALALTLLAGREEDVGRHGLPVGRWRLALQPRAPPRAGEPAARHRRQVVDRAERTEILHGLQHAQRERGAANATAREREPHVRLVVVVRRRAVVASRPALGNLRALGGQHLLE